MESSLGVFFLGLMALCALLITIALLTLTYETHRTMGTARQLLARANKAAAQIERMIDQTCGVAEGLLGQIDRVREKAHALWARQFGNGASLRSRKGVRYRRFESNGQRK